MKTSITFEIGVIEKTVVETRIEVNTEYLAHKAELIVLGRVIDKKIDEITYMAGIGSTVVARIVRYYYKGVKMKELCSFPNSF